jgi:hypothetical protein
VGGGFVYPKKISVLRTAHTGCIFDATIAQPHIATLCENPHSTCPVPGHDHTHVRSAHQTTTQARSPLRYALTQQTHPHLAKLGCITARKLATLRQHVCNKLYRRQTLRPANFVHNTTQQLDMPTTHPQMPSYARPFWETPTSSCVKPEPNLQLRHAYGYPQQRSTGGLPQVPLGGYIH